MQARQRVVNLTDQQKDLLRLLVSQHELRGGAEFLLARSSDGAGLVDPGGGPSVSVAYDDSDFYQLRRENLITLARVQTNVHRGKPTQLGITLVQRGFAPPGADSARLIQNQRIEKEAMDYPQEFSSQARARVEAERLKAKRDLEQARTEQPPKPWTMNRWDECAFHRYILRVFLAFAREACELGKQGTWTVDRIRSEADEFLRRFTIEAYSEKGHDRYGREFRNMVSNWNGSLLPEVKYEFQKSEEWLLFEEELLAVAERQAALRPQQSGDESNPIEVGPGASWQAIEVSFLSDERVQIRNGTSTETRNYEELGFADGRTGKPNQAWVTLRALAEAGGIIRDAAKTGRDWPRVEKRMQEIRRAFRKHFGIAADPVPFIDGTGYQACFKIGCSPSFHT